MSDLLILSLLQGDGATADNQTESNNKDKDAEVLNTAEVSMLLAEPVP